MIKTMTEHIPVLLKETILGLDPKKGDVLIDGTINTGGHSKAISEYLGKTGHIIGIDRDSDALKLAAKNLKGVLPKVTLIHGNYRDMDTLVAEKGIKEVDCILLDIGLSNRQLFDSNRGFSFQKDEPLMMTFNPKPAEDELTAEEIVNTWDEENIADIIYGYGEERFAKRIAKGIVMARKEAPIKGTIQLVDIVLKSVPVVYRKGHIHPATKTFQALRITVNDELRALKEGIEKAIGLLKDGGKLAIITFHSGEDRIVKNFFKEYQNQHVIKILTKKPISGTPEELRENPKARSAKLRVLQKIKA
jgi:16S rRNA (cytosine1402-N4)-methyltransferase